MSAPQPPFLPRHARCGHCGAPANAKHSTYLDQTCHECGYTEVAGDYCSQCKAGRVGDWHPVQQSEGQRAALARGRQALAQRRLAPGDKPGIRAKRPHVDAAHRAPSEEKRMEHRAPAARDHRYNISAKGRARGRRYNRTLAGYIKRRIWGSARTIRLQDRMTQSLEEK
jgi:hypothetical protein